MLHWVLLLSLAGYSLSACSDYDKHAVDGVNGRFCLPKGMSPPNIWYVPDDPPNMPKGFAFIGCGYVDSATDTCNLPDGLISASVRPLSLHVNHTRSELTGAVLFDEAVNSPGAKYEWMDRGKGIFVLKSQSSSIPWTIWKRNGGAPESEVLKISGSDELLADCAPTYTSSVVDGTSQALTDISCSRYVAGRAYAIEYEFKREKDLPTEDWLRNFDAELFRKIDSWHCPS